MLFKKKKMTLYVYMCTYYGNSCIPQRSPHHQSTVFTTYRSQLVVLLLLNIYMYFFPGTFERSSSLKRTSAFIPQHFFFFFFLIAVGSEFNSPEDYFTDDNIQ